MVKVWVMATVTVSKESSEDNFLKTASSCNVECSSAWGRPHECTMKFSFVSAQTLVYRICRRSGLLFQYVLDICQISASATV